VNKGILDSRGQKLSLEEAIRQRLVEIRELKVSTKVPVGKEDDGYDGYG
jgi:hypothetical protein